MKRILAVSAIVLLADVYGMSWAANAVPTPVSLSANTPLHQLGMKFRTDMIQIQKDQKSGKLTQAQANQLREQIKTIHKQELADMKTNGKKEITVDQENTLMSQLEVVEKSL